MAPQTTEHLASEDAVARCAIYPKFLNSAAFDHTKLLRFDRHDEPPRSFALSVASIGILDGDVHSYGCRTAASGNSRKAEKLGRKLNSPHETSHYLGFYKALVETCVACGGDYYEVRVVSAPEDGEKAHAHILIVERADVDQNVHKGAKRIEIVDRLWRAISGPERHICSVDEEVRAHLEAIVLPSMP